MSDAKSSAALARKKAEIEKLLDEFSWHISRLDAISREAGQKLGSFSAFVKEHGYEDGIPVAIELVEKLRAIATKFEKIKSGGSPTDVV